MIIKQHSAAGIQHSAKETFFIHSARMPFIFLYITANAPGSGRHGFPITSGSGGHGDSFRYPD